MPVPDKTAAEYPAWQRATAIYRRIVDAAPDLKPHSYLLHIPRENRAWIGFQPTRMVAVSRRGLELTEAGKRQRFDIQPQSALNRLRQWVDPARATFFIISADLVRKTSDPDLPLIQVIQPSLEITLHGDQPADIDCSQEGLQELANRCLEGESSPAPLPPYIGPGDWDWESEAEVLSRIEASVAALQEIEGKVIAMRAATSPRNSRLDPLRLYEIYASLETGCAAGHFLDSGDGDISIGMSPENIFAIDRGKLFYDVVASTRGKSPDAAIDRRWEKELREDPKEVGEHTMALSRYRERLESLCKPGTVHMHEHMQVLNLHCVRHLYSRLSGDLAPERDVFDLLAGHFPPLASYPEQLADYGDAGDRPWYYYGGMLGRIAPGAQDACCYLNIRAALLREKQVHIQAGAGIVRRSVPRQEMLEIRNKLHCLGDAFSRWENEAGQ